MIGPDAEIDTRHGMLMVLLATPLCLVVVLQLLTASRWRFWAWVLASRRGGIAGIDSAVDRAVRFHLSGVMELRRDLKSKYLVRGSYRARDPLRDRHGHRPTGSGRSIGRPTQDRFAGRRRLPLPRGLMKRDRLYDKVQEMKKPEGSHRREPTR